MTTPNRERVQQPVQIEALDRQRPVVSEECRRQSQAVAAADAADPGLHAFLDAALADLDNESET
ncbi:hypothetical protein ASG52_21105 [Methylobacterium sp. Leaf456]|uniref:antitoxin MazE-like protein n=1 Tax=Methylobacterium sp. Leaf456 TaxID=1736382 RepID=UPI0006F35D2D|nr:antitoxin MazE-like protein [Methylobacterium sp. Leaf456]KQT58635.1 hypothetical protein ASG52_21105 [Methylobacterium sp. Leaf456]